jgi:UDP-GlcNAc3NAcA epimerase
VEAGLRSYNRNMPEEINRIATDHISDLLFAPTQNAIRILQDEGLQKSSVFCGDVMFGSILFYKDLVDEKYSVEEALGLNDFYLATIHRSENKHNSERLQNIFSVFSDLDQTVILPLYLRTRQKITSIEYSENIKIIEPVSYLQMIYLLKNCMKVLTDSGGLQKEVYFIGKPCITLSNQTEWPETLENGWNFIVSSDKDRILEKVYLKKVGRQNNAFGDGYAAVNLSNEILKYN